MNGKLQIFLDEFCTNVLVNSADTQQPTNIVIKFKKHLKIVFSGFSLYSDLYVIILLVNRE